MKRCPDCDMDINTLEVSKVIGDMSHYGTWDYAKYVTPFINVRCSECGHTFDSEGLKALGMPAKLIKQILGEATK